VQIKRWILAESLRRVVGAAGEGFEPRLTDPLESVSIHPWLFAVVQKSAFLS
jgi:hypothetical protein